jgi:hypothetical protein
MTTENLVTIDFESEIINNNNAIDVNVKNHQKSSSNYNQELIPDVSFSEEQSILEDCERISCESQPLLGGDHHDHITYNQFPGEFKSTQILLSFDCE